MDLYTLIGHIPVRCPDMMEWARWRQANDTHVDHTPVGPLWVSTVFLGIDHGFSFGPVKRPPILFETMIYTDELYTHAHGFELPHFADMQTRCSTWAQAEQMHAAAVRMAKEWLAEAEDTAKAWTPESSA